MKNVKLFLNTVVVFLALGISTVNAQQKQSVIISEICFNSNITIEVIRPDYSIDKQEYSKKEDNASVVLKKELDKWINQGFKIQSTTTQVGTTVLIIFTYVLVKED
ncbi:MAG: hypothetical protein ABI207_06050 [Crocinitomicaceae bacterium]